MALTILVGRAYLLYKHHGKLSQKRDFRFCLSFLEGKKKRGRLEGKIKQEKMPVLAFKF